MKFLVYIFDIWLKWKKSSNAIRIKNRLFVYIVLKKIYQILISYLFK